MLQYSCISQFFTIIRDPADSLTGAGRLELNVFNSAHTSSSAGSLLAWTTSSPYGPRSADCNLLVSAMLGARMGAGQCGNDRPGFGVHSITQKLSAYNNIRVKHYKIKLYNII